MLWAPIREEMEADPSSLFKGLGQRALPQEKLTQVVPDGQGIIGDSVGAKEVIKVLVQVMVHFRFLCPFGFLSYIGIVGVRGFGEVIKPVRGTCHRSPMLIKGR
jgi:hypothetical protein